MDIRERAASQRWWSWHNGREAEMDDYTKGEDEDGEPIQVQIPIEMQVCPTCDGRGCYVNPSIDSHGLSQEDFDSEPGFYENYRSGVYDIRCEHCQGENVIPWPTQAEDRKRVDEWLGTIEAWDADAEMERRMGA